MSTIENLQVAFAGESQANRRYLAFAERAEKDGYGQVARLFRAAAQAETIHAHAHLGALGGVRDTADNLQAAIEGEGYEFKEMYPAFLAEAEEEGSRRAEASFKNALAVEEVHYGLYSTALEAVKEGNDLEDAAIHVCPVCGNTIVGEVSGACSVCGVPAERFVEVK